SDSAIVIDKAYYQADGSGLIKPGYRQIFVLPSEGGTPRQLTSGNYHHGGKLAWRADAQAIVFSANRIADWEYKRLEGDLFEVDFNRNITQLTSAPGREYAPSFSENGKKLAYLSASNALNPYR
ncbi:DPP IV N-terminal domain-containing protein, partial [Pseudoalteromonas sp. S1941]